MWHVYFLTKVYLLWSGYAGFDPLPNLLLLGFVLVPLPTAWRARTPLRAARQALAIILAALLLWHDSWLPPASEIHQFLTDPMTAPTPAYVVEFLARSLMSPLWIPVLALALISWTARRWTRTLAAFSAGAMVLAALLAIEFTEPRAAVEFAAFHEAEAKRRVAFPDGAPGTDFDIVLLHVCSMGLDDLAVAGLSDHPLLGKFDVILPEFNSVTGYSGSAAYRLLRSGCGQAPHDMLWAEAEPGCYLMDTLRERGYRSYSAMDHSGHYAEFTESTRRLGHIDAPLDLAGLPARQIDFDGSTIHDDFAVLERWWRLRERDAAPRAALYYNSIMLHEGANWPEVSGWNEMDRVSRYRFSAERLFADFQRFFDLLSASGRTVAVFLIPEHGAALRGSRMQLTGLREIPLPHITRVQVGLKLFGPDLPPREAARVVAGPTSYQAVAWLVADLIRSPPFSRSRGASSMDLAGLPRTPFVAENGNVRILRSGEDLFMLGKQGRWLALPPFAWKPISD